MTDETPPCLVAERYQGRDLTAVENVRFEKLEALDELLARLDGEKPPGVIDHDGDEFVVSFDYNPVIVAAIKLLPRRAFSAPDKTWRVAFHAESVDGLCWIASRLGWTATAHAMDRAIDVLEHPPPEEPSHRVDLYTDDESLSWFRVLSEYDEALVRQIRRIPGATWTPKGQFWRVPAHALDACTLLTKVLSDYGDLFALSESAAAALKEAEERTPPQATAEERAEQQIRDASPRQESVQSRSADEELLLEWSTADSAADVEIAALGGQLRDFQRAGVRYLLATRRALLADEMGLGKTIQALAAIETASAYPALIICPKAVKLNWRHEAVRWLPNKRSIGTVRDGKTPPPHTDLVITTYSVLKKHQVALIKRGFRTIVADESHYLKNRKAQRTHAAVAIAGSVSDIRLALTGTPFMQGPVNLAMQLEFIGRLAPNFGGFWQFANRYCDPQEDKYGAVHFGASRIDELAQRLRSTCYCRREKSDVLTQLPEKLRNQQFIPLASRDTYLEIEMEVEGRAVRIREEEANDSPDYEGFAERRKKRERQMLGLLQRLVHECGRQKVRAAVEWIETFAESGESLAVFAHHQDVIGAILARFPEAATIVGADSDDARAEAVQRFQSGETNLIVCSVTAAGVGITLTRAAHTAFVELAWTAATHNQAEDRVHRIGQERQVTAWYLLAEDTIDERVWQVLERQWALGDAFHGSAHLMVSRAFSL